MLLKLPVMQCDDGCGECCGVVPCTTQEYDRVVRYAEEHGIHPVAQGLTCPFYQGGKCAVYPVRPHVCQIFGHFDDPHLTCPHGYNTNVTPRRQREIEAKYLPQVRHGKTRLLHECLPTTT